MALTKITPQMFDTSAAGHDFNIDNGTFVVDASANRVGIGTTTPSTLLDVNGVLTATSIAGTLTTAAQTNITSLGTLTALTVDDITIDGSTISDAGEFTLDIGGDIILDSDNGVWRFKDAGTTVFQVARDSNSYLNLYCGISDMDMRFQGNDGGSTVTALTLDMSAAGAATFNAGVTAPTFTGTLSTAAQTNITSVGTLTSLTSGAHLINASSSAFGGSSVQGFNTDFLVDTGQGYSRHNSYHTGGSNHQFLVNATGSTTNTVALSINKDANATFNAAVTVNGNTTIRSGNKLILNRADNATGGEITYGPTGTGFIFNDVNGDDTIFKTGSTEHMRIDAATSRVGIGISSGMDRDLHIKGSSSDPGIQIEKTGSHELRVAVDSTGPYLYAEGTAPLRFYQNNAEIIRITGGNVNIGSKAFITNHNSTVDSLQVGYALNLYEDSYSSGTDNYVFLANNAYYAQGTGNVYMRTDEASRFYQNAGNFYFQNAPSGTAGTGISFATRFFISAGGYVGIGAGNTNPVSTLHVDNANVGTALVTFHQTSGNSSADRGLDVETSSTGTTVQRWLNSGAEKARFTGSGYLLIGTTDATPYNNNADSTADNGISLSPDGWISNARHQGTVLYLNRTGNNGQILAFMRSGATKGEVAVTTTSTQYYTTSDARLKDNIVDAPSASEDIDSIQVRSFDWKEDDSHQKYGMIAQELLSVAPDAVSQPEDSEEMMSIDYSKLVPMLVKEIQSLRTRVTQLEEEK